MTAVGKLNPNSTIKDYVRGLQETSPNDRHIVLADIRAALGSEKFSEWYNEVYKLRSAGKHVEYEQAIKSMFDNLQADAQAQADKLPTVITWNEAMQQREKDFNRRYYNNPNGEPSFPQENKKCICTQIFTPNPVVNPDCPMHGTMYIADERNKRGNR